MPLPTTLSLSSPPNICWVFFFHFLFHGGHRLAVLFSTASSITKNPKFPLSLLILIFIFLFHSKPFANPSPIAPPTNPLCEIQPSRHSDEHGGRRGRHGNKARHDELLRAGREGGAGDRSGVPGRQYRDSGEDGGDRRLQCGAGGVDRKLTKPEMGHLEKAGTIPMRHLQEFRLVALDGFELNQKLSLKKYKI